MTRSAAHSGSRAAEAGLGLELRLEDLRRSYGDLHALDGLSLTVEPGELVALLGPSGCGKTTALRIVAGLDEADSGRVVLDGADISGVPASRRDMGMVFQAYSLFPHMTSLQNVEFGLRLRGVDRGTRSRRAGEMLDLVGLSQHASRYAHQLSGGQQQRVALARALAIEPAVLLLDEPLSALDAKVRAQLRDEIRRVQIEVGTTTLFVTHDQEEALAMADRVGVMSRGRLEQVAPPSQLYARPVSRSVAEFVGLMNQIPADAVDGRARVLGASVPMLSGSIRAGSGTALVRPESVDVRAAAGQGDGRVLTVSFLGPISRVRVVTAQQTELVAQLASVDAVGLAPGEPVDITVAETPILVVETTEGLRSGP